MNDFLNRYRFRLKSTMFAPRKTLFHCARILLGVVFLVAAADKILNPADFARILYNYQILPDRLINVVAVLLPWLEAVLGLALVLGLWLPGAVVLSQLLLITFFGVLLFNLARGLDVQCGCFGASVQGKPQTTWYLIRDAGFLALGGYLTARTLFRATREPGYSLSEISKN